MPETEDRIAAIRAHHAYVTAKTPAPWRWHGNDEMRQLYLATENHGRIFVMGFARWGMREAQPTFQAWPDKGFGQMTKAAGLIVKAEEAVVREREYRGQIDHIDNPHADYLRAAPEYIATLLARIDELEADRG